MYHYDNKPTHLIQVILIEGISLLEVNSLGF